MDIDEMQTALESVEALLVYALLASGGSIFVPEEVAVRGVRMDSKTIAVERDPQRDGLLIRLLDAKLVNG